jgi:hypothetical protein
MHMAGGKRAGYKLATYRTSDGPRAGVIVGDDVFDAEKITGKAAYATSPASSLTGKPPKVL